MIKAWVFLSTLAIGVVFNLIWVPARKSPNDPPPQVETVKFPYSEYELSKHSFWYYILRYLNVAAIAACACFTDRTPKPLLVLFVVICIIDLIHFRLFYRSEGSGYNLMKILLYGIPTAWTQLRHLRR